MKPIIEAIKIVSEKEEQEMDNHYDTYEIETNKSGGNGGNYCGDIC